MGWDKLNYVTYVQPSKFPSNLDEKSKLGCNKIYADVLRDSAFIVWGWCYVMTPCQDEEKTNTW